MTPNRLVARLGAVSLAAAILVLPACQGEPDPIPTATLPTPVTPTPWPSPSPNPTQVAADEAAAAYIEGRRKAERMVVDGSDADVRKALSPYFAGEYLSYWESVVEELRRDKLDAEGPVAIDIVAAGDYSSDSGAQTIYLDVCVDFTETTTTDSSGNELGRDSDYSLDTVRMKSDKSGWRAVEFGSKFLSNLDDSECSRSFS